MVGEVASLPSRRDARRAARREAILEVAEHSFLERGYATTSMSAIAASLGGSKATLWTYFDSKQQLFAAVLDRATTTFRQHAPEILNPRAELSIALRGFALEFLRKVTSPHGLALNRLVIGEAHRFAEIGQIFHERVMAPTHQLLACYIAEAMDRRLLRREDPNLLAEHFIALCQAGIQQKLLLGVVSTPNPATLGAHTERGVAAFLRAYGAG